ncbi:Sm-like ribonucleo protein [Caulochytrium protostelioides]|uniref:Sm protein B n=1 Tax=Caulochytrium protostelioides TaxID=1555241 RepID=A0A4P9WTV1_9FUNG|nr:Sm-like ribonucleo protein [Caulochytrium protostelioides]
MASSRRSCTSHRIASAQPTVKASKIIHLLNYRLRIVIQDGRALVGQMLAFDRHMNLVIGDCQEFRTLKPKTKGGAPRQEKRTLGLVILRGETIVSMSIESPPPLTEAQKAKMMASIEKSAGGGPGTKRPIGRGMPLAPPAGTGLAPPGMGAFPPPMPPPGMAGLPNPLFGHGAPRGPPGAGLPMPPPPPPGFGRP